MAFFKSIFGKKKEDDDGQAEYFRDDFDPVVKKPATKKAEPKAAVPAKEPKPEKKPAAKKAEPKPVEKSEKIVSAKSNNPKSEKAETKKPTTVKKALDEKKTTAKKTAQNKETKAPKKTPKTQELNDDSPEVKGAVAVQESKATANGKFDIRRAKDGRYFFSLYASNHTVIAYSQIYSSTTAVNTGINSVITNAPKCEIEDTTLKKPLSLPCPKWEIYIDKAGEYRFRLYAPNGLVICHAAHGYSTKSGCKGGIESIKRFSAEAKVNKSY